jgi:hypothetical protein
MMQPISLKDLLLSSQPVYLAASADKDGSQKTDFIRQKCPQGLLIACWHQREAAQKFIHGLPMGGKNYRVIQADKQALAKIVSNIGESDRDPLFVLQT